jgi:hypothetical protein
MGSPFEMKQACLYLSDSALALFDLIDAEGVEAPINDHNGITQLKAVFDTAEQIRKHYALHNIQRMLALGISPSDFIEKFKEE